jgi:Tol biopolymer transport system component
MVATLVVAAALVSPPPGRIVFDRISVDGQSEHIYRERADGTGVVRISRSGRYWSEPRWSPDGRLVAAFSERGITIVTPSGLIVRSVQAVGSTADLTWSPDGRWFAYVAQHCQDPLGHEDPSCGTLWVVRVDGTGQRRVSREGKVALVSSFDRPYTWSPDGRRIAYAGFNGLVVADILTGRRHLLGPTARIYSVPDWSPDGRRLLYAYGDELVTSAPDGSDRRAVHGARDTLLAAWSPDGTRIAYIEQFRGDDWRVFVSRADGTARVQLGEAHSDAPLVWSPGGTHVLVGVAGGDRFEIFSVDGHGRPRFIRGGDSADWTR